MVTTGSKLFFGYAFAALAAAVVYGVATELDGAFDFKSEVPFIALPAGIVDALLGPLTLGYKGGVGDHLGYSVLVGLAAVFFCLGVMSSAFRDADAESVAEVGHGVLGRIDRAVGVSFWPALTSFGVGCIVVGLAVSALLVALGLAIFGLMLLEWTASVWAESATGDPEVNRAARNRLMFPLEVPILAVVILGGIVLLISRILLAVPELGSVGVAIGAAALILGVAALIATRKTINRSTVAVSVAIGAVLLLVAGVLSAAAGSREVEHHEPENGGEAAAVTMEGDR